MKYSRFLFIAILVASQIACADDSSTTAPSDTTAPIPIYVLTPTTLSLGIGDSTQIRVVVTGSDYTQRLVTTSATWASANTTVATVTGDGVVTARATGTAVITVTVTEGTATVTVTVSNESQPMTFVGAVAGPSTETATLRFTANSPPRLLGTVYFRQSVVSLIGRVDEPTQVVDLERRGLPISGCHPRRCADRRLFRSAWSHGRIHCHRRDAHRRDFVLRVLHIRRHTCSVIPIPARWFLRFRRMGRRLPALSRPTPALPPGIRR